MYIGTDTITISVPSIFVCFSFLFFFNSLHISEIAKIHKFCKGYTHKIVNFLTFFHISKKIRGKKIVKKIPLKNKEWF